MSHRRTPPGRGNAPAPRGRRRGRISHAVGGDRPFALGVLVVTVLMALMAVGPLERYWAAADRVDALVRERDALTEEVDALEQRAAELEDPEEIELLARSELGFVLPGDEAYVIVGPSPSPQAPPDPAPDGEVAWYQRMGRALSELVR